MSQNFRHHRAILGPRWVSDVELNYLISGCPVEQPKLQYYRSREKKREMQRFLSGQIRKQDFSENDSQNDFSCPSSADAHSDRDDNGSDVSNRYGIVHFDDDHSDREYVCLDEQNVHTNPAEIWTYMSEIWKITPPKMIISLSGGQRNFTPNFEAKFRKSLINLATATDAWIITDGVETGIVKLVGEAVKEHKFSSGKGGQGIVTLGIARWGKVSNRSRLQGGKGKYGCFPAHYTTQQPCMEENSTPLNPNHTHFLLVDGDSHTSIGEEIELRTEIERYISSNVKGKWFSGDTEVPVPVIRLIFDGKGAMRSALKVIEKDIPVIVIENQICSSSGDEDENESQPGTSSATIERCSLGEITSKLMTRRKGEKKGPRCKQKHPPKKHQLITVMDQNEVEIDHGLEEKCLEKLLETVKFDSISLLELARRLDSIEVYDSHFGRKERRKSLNLNKALMDALLQDSSKFINFILEQNNNWKSLTRDELRDLYDKVLFKEDSSPPLHSLLKEKLEAGQKKIQKKHGSKEDKCDSGPANPWTLRAIGKIIKKLVGGNGRNIYTGKEDSSYGKAARDLFLWAVLMNFQNSAWIFIRKCKNPIGGALTASSLLSGLAKMVGDANELGEADKIQKEAHNWERVAYVMMDKFYEQNLKRAHQSLVTNIPTWGDRTLFEMADSGMKKLFMSHSSCQSKLNDIWYGNMGFQTPILQMLLCMFCPLCILTIHFKDDGNSTKHDNRVGLADIMPCKDAGEENAASKNSSPSCKTRCKKFFYQFYWFYSAPCIKMGNYVVSTLVFAGLFSFFLMNDLHPTDKKTPSVVEYIVWGWAGTLFIEEIRQVATIDAKLRLRNLCLYWTKNWNKIDALFLFFLIISVILRLNLHGDHFGWARISYSITLMMYFWRSLRFFYATKHIGPKVIMFRKMIEELVFVGAILLTVITGYGVAVQSLRQPNRNGTPAVFTDVFYHPYLHLYGELFLNDTYGAVDGCDQTLTNCPEEYWFATILFACYLVFILLLLNLFIAVFSFILKDVLKSSEKLWQFYRYDLIYEYHDRPTLAPPLIIINHIWSLCCWICCKRACNRACKHNISTVFREIPSKFDELILSSHERMSVEDCDFRNLDDRFKDEIS